MGLMKKRILFILSAGTTGGIVSSFVSLYNSIENKYDIKVLFAASAVNTSFPFSKDVISDSLLISYTTPFSSLNIRQKIISLFLQPYKRFNIRNNGGKLPPRIGGGVARRLMKKYHFDVVVGFSEGLPSILASCFKIKSIAWIHCDYKRYYDAVCRYKDEAKMYSQIDEVVCVSNYTKDSFLRIYPTLAPKTQYIYNLIDSTRILKMSKEPINDNRFKTNLFTIISVGRIDPVKRFSSIPTIAYYLMRAGIAFRWYIIGPECDKTELLTLEERIDKYGLKGFVVLLGGKVNPYSYMLNSNLYVCLSSSEACPMVFNEAKILGLPILTTNFGSAYEFIKDGDNGIISSLEKLPERLLELISDKNKLEAIRPKGDLAQYNKEIIKNIDKLFLGTDAS